MSFEKRLADYENLEIKRAASNMVVSSQMNIFYIRVQALCLFLYMSFCLCFGFSVRLCVCVPASLLVYLSRCRVFFVFFFSKFMERCPCLFMPTCLQEPDCLLQRLQDLPKMLIRRSGIKETIQGCTLDQSQAHHL